MLHDDRKEEEEGENNDDDPMLSCKPHVFRVTKEVLPSFSKTLQPDSSFEQAEISSPSSPREKVNFVKVFVNSGCTSDSFKEEKRNDLLNHKSPTYQHHFTFFTFFVNKIHLPKVVVGFDTYLRSHSRTEEGISIEMIKPRYELMGKQPEFFSIVFDLKEKDAKRFNGTTLKDMLAAFLVDEFDCLLSDELLCFDNEGYEEYASRGDRTTVVRVKRNVSFKKYHVSLFSSSDLKRCNKKKFKEYRRSADRREFLEKEFGSLSKDAELGNESMEDRSNSWTLSLSPRINFSYK